MPVSLSTTYLTLHTPRSGPESSRTSTRPSRVLLCVRDGVETARGVVLAGQYDRLHLHERPAHQSCSNAPSASSTRSACGLGRRLDARAESGDWIPSSRPGNSGSSAHRRRLICHPRAETRREPWCVLVACRGRSRSGPTMDSELLTSRAAGARMRWCRRRRDSRVLL